MAFFCDKSSVRIVAPGTARSAGGNIPDHDGTPKSNAVEAVAMATLKAQPRANCEAPGEETIKAAVKAALEAFDTEPDTKPKAKAKADN